MNLENIIGDEKLHQIEELSRAFFTPEEISIVIEIDFEQIEELFTKANGGPVYQAYMRGKLKRKFELNNLIISQAIAGSQPAQIECEKLTEEQNAKE